MTRVIHIRDAPPGWKNNPHYEYIGRGSKWGNRYSHLSSSAAMYKVNSRDEACDMFEQRQLPELMKDIHELRGKTLVCFCHPQRCHGHSLARAADGGTLMHEIVGDLFAYNDRGPSAICITTNGFVNGSGANTMGRGCAAEAKRRWPGVQMTAGERIRDSGNICQLLTHPGPDGRPVLTVPERWKPSHYQLPYHLIAFPVKPVEAIVLPDKSNLVGHMRSRVAVGERVYGWACVADPGLIEGSAFQLVELADTHRFGSVVLPRPGCGAGELDWEGHVRPLLQEILDSRFWVITFKK